MKKTEDKYEPQVVEEKWQKKWASEKLYSPDLDKAKKPFYNLMMFPYPSAEGLHVGNMYAFTGADVSARFQRMKGNDVFEPIGLDGFGIHSENYALKVGSHPMEQSAISEKNFYRQMHAIGNSFDWARTVETYKPEYYQWTQWLFVQLFKLGLAYRKKALVNWCPSCKTVLSDEQVIDAKCERCSSQVEKRDLEQWFFRITDYAERLLNNIPALDWTEKVKIAQTQWIGKKDGALVRFALEEDLEKYIEIFTTRPDTLFGATFLVLSPEHPLVKEILSSQPKADQYMAEKVKEISKYVKEAKSKSEIERTAADKIKTGVFTGSYCINPVNGEKVQIWIADYALMGYGTGALFGDAHDERDVSFAKKYDIPLKPTLATGDQDRDKRIMNLEECFTGYGILVDSGQFTGLSSHVAMKQITAWLEKEGKGSASTNYHLRDWLISRQRYWGPPIPMIYCEKCASEGKSWFTSNVIAIRQLAEKQSHEGNGIATSSRRGGTPRNDTEWDSAGWYPVPDKELPVLLPKISDYRPIGIHSAGSGQAGQSPLGNHPEFYRTTCPECGGEAKRETDVSDTFLDSAWYFFRYISTDVYSTAFDIARAKKWLPVNMYIGGAEHSVLHLLYARFITMTLKDLGLISFEEPFTKFVAHGLIIKDGAKMSKSKGNVVVPDIYISKYGADTLRLYLMFIGSFSQGGDFRDTGIEGMNRFVRRVWTLLTGVIASPAMSGINSAKQSGIAALSPSGDLRSSTPRNDNMRMMHKTIKKVTEDISSFHYNTAIAALMEWYNYLSQEDRRQKTEVSREEAEVYLKLLSPFAPHLTEELWQRLEVGSGKQEVGKNKSHDSYSMLPNSSFLSVHQQSWPTFDKKYLVSDQVTVVVQVNGRVRDQIVIPSDQVDDKSHVETKARESEKILGYLEGKTVKNVIVVSGKVINFVIEQ